MTERAIDQIRERIRQNRVARQQRADAQQAKPITPEARLGAAHLVGARVFDTVSGQEGEIVGITRENIIVPSAGR